MAGVIDEVLQDLVVVAEEELNAESLRDKIKSIVSSIDKEELAPEAFLWPPPPKYF